MPTGTRLRTPITRSYLTDPRFASVKSPLARETFFRIKLNCDNCGRLPGEADMAGGLLYPMSPPKRTAMESVLKELRDAGMIFWFRVGKFSYIEVCDNGMTQTLVGNMTADSEYPAAPRELIEAWEKRFARKWEPIRKASSRPSRDDSAPDSRESEHVYTGTNESERVHAVRVGLGQGQKGLGSDEGRAGPDAANGVAARSPDGSLSASLARNKKNTLDPDRDHNFAEWLGVAGQGVLPGQYVGEQARHIFGRLAGGRYRDELDFQMHEGEAWNAFAQLVVETFDCFWDEQYQPLVGDEKFMSAVVNASRNDGRVRPGWLRVLNDVRRELKANKAETAGEAQR